jgi:hypothetical protein
LVQDLETHGEKQSTWKKKVTLKINYWVKTISPW